MELADAHKEFSLCAYGYKAKLAKVFNMSKFFAKQEDQYLNEKPSSHCPSSHYFLHGIEIMKLKKMADLLTMASSQGLA